MVKKQHQLSCKDIMIDDPFWIPHIQMNANIAIFNQWDQLEKTHCIDNFRITIGLKQGFHEGWFFSDSDAYKWLDAACRINTSTLTYSKRLEKIIQGFVELIRRAQEQNGYIYTFNQIHFPNIRWKNLWIEHELYCLGHLIEAIIAYYEIYDNQELLEIAVNAADLIVQEFMEAKPQAIPGHQEIEIALIRLYHITYKKEYLELAKQFILRRGRSNFKWLQLIKQAISNRARVRKVDSIKRKYFLENLTEREFELPENVYTRYPAGLKKRVLYNYLSNKYLQNHKIVEKQIVPEGHAVRFLNMMTALAMISNKGNNQGFTDMLESVHNHMVSKRMFITGGIGSLPGVEGFGRDYELNTEYNYCETCAAVSSLYWNWEMTLLTGDSWYADLFEWQLYNAFLVGISLDGRSYLYRNPLSTEHQKITRQKWFAIPCCPSNVSRTLASLGKYIYSFNDENLWVHQYIGSKTIIHQQPSFKIQMNSHLPWEGKIKLIFTIDSPILFTIHIRIPSWTSNGSMYINEEVFNLGEKSIVTSGDSQANKKEQMKNIKTAGGYSPYCSYYETITREWKDGDSIKLEFPMKIRMIESHPLTKLIDKATITYGPIVYCLESIDNPNLDLYKLVVDPSTIEKRYENDLFNGINIIKGKTIDNADIIAIPYPYWGNRGPSEMNTILNI